MLVCVCYCIVQFPVHFRVLVAVLHLLTLSKLMMNGGMQEFSVVVLVVVVPLLLVVVGLNYSYEPLSCSAAGSTNGRAMWA